MDFVANGSKNVEIETSTGVYLRHAIQTHFVEIGEDYIELVNRYVKGNVDIGRIDLTANCSFFEVPEADAEYVMRKMAKAKVGDRRVVVDSADRQGESADRQRPNRTARRAERFGGQRHEDYSQRKGGRKGGRYADADQFEKPGRDNDWRQFFDK